MNPCHGITILFADESTVAWKFSSFSVFKFLCIWPRKSPRCPMSPKFIFIDVICWLSLLVFNKCCSSPTSRRRNMYIRHNKCLLSLLGIWIFSGENRSTFNRLVALKRPTRNRTHCLLTFKSSNWQFVVGTVKVSNIVDKKPDTKWIKFTCNFMHVSTSHWRYFSSILVTILAIIVFNKLIFQSNAPIFSVRRKSEVKLVGRRFRSRKKKTKLFHNAFGGLFFFFYF